MNRSSIPIFCPIVTIDQHSGLHASTQDASETGIKIDSGVLTEFSSHAKLLPTAAQGSFLQFGKKKLQGLAKFATRIVTGLICTAVLSQAAFAVCTNPVTNGLNPGTGSGNWNVGTGWVYGGGQFPNQYGNSVDNIGTSDLSTRVSDVTNNPILGFDFQSHSPGTPASVMRVLYNNIQYASIDTHGGGGNNWKVTAANGATCVSGCGPFGPDSYHQVSLRLPAGLLSTGDLVFRAVQINSGAVDDIFVGAVSMTRQPSLCLSERLAGPTAGSVSLSGTNVDFLVNTDAVDTTFGSPGIGANSTLELDGSTTAQGGNQAFRVPAVGAPVTINQTALPAGYSLQSVTCDNGVTPTVNRAGKGSFTISSFPNALVACTVTNSQAPQVIVKKTTSNGSGNNTFSYAFGGLTVPADPLTVATPGSTTSTVSHVGTVNVQATINESTVPAGWPTNPASVTCIDSNAAGSTNGTGNLASVAGSQATLQGSVMKSGAVIVCEFINTKPTVTLNKLVSGTRPTGDSGLFNLTVGGGNAFGSNNPATNQGSGGTTNAVSVDTASAITLTETAGSSTSMSNYTSSIVCSDGNGATATTGGSNGSFTVTSPAASAVGNAKNLTCTITNTVAGADLSIDKTQRRGISGAFFKSPPSSAIARWPTTRFSFSWWSVTLGRVEPAARPLATRYPATSQTFLSFPHLRFLLARAVRQLSPGLS